MQKDLSKEPDALWVPDKETLDKFKALIDPLGVQKAMITIAELYPEYDFTLSVPVDHASRVQKKG